MSSLFYIYPLSGRAVVVSIIIRDTKIATNTVFEFVLLMDSSSGLTFSIKTEKGLLKTNSELNTITGLSSLYYINPSSGRAVEVPIVTRDTGIVNNTIFEPVLHNIFISQPNFTMRRNQQHICINAF